jgi:hypothetical protein
MGVCRKSHLYQARGWILHTAKRSNRGVKKNYRAKGGKVFALGEQLNKALARVLQ